MPFDLYLTIGLVVLLFAIPSVVSAFSDRHTPRVASIMVLVGGGLVAWAVTQKPGGYVLTEVPEVVIGVLASVVR